MCLSLARVTPRQQKGEPFKGSVVSPTSAAAIVVKLAMSPDLEVRAVSE
jgi:hypothetical protein